MINEKFLLFVLALIQFAHIVDFMIIMPLGAQFMKLFDISPRQFSLMVTAYAISATVAGFLSAMYIDRFDRKPVLLFTFLGFTIGTLGCAFADTYELFLVARAFTGAFGGILSALTFAIVADVVPFERRSSAMGIVMTAFSVASIVGVPAGIFLAANFGMKMPFFVVGGVSVLLVGLIILLIPPLRFHLSKDGQRVGPLKVLQNIINDNNQLRALSFGIILMLGHFTIIPFIAPYMQLNVGFSDQDVTYIYLCGGVVSAIMLPTFGIIADRLGNVQVFTIASFFALLSIFAITNLGPVSMIIALFVTTSFFLVASGRSVPAMTMVTSVVKPENRGSFMSIRASANELALALSSFLAGLIVTENPDGSLGNYELVGYFTIFMSVVAIAMAWRLKAVS